MQRQGWIPVRASWQDGELQVNWSYLGRQRFTEPFFEGTIAASAHRPFNQLFGFQTPIAALEQDPADLPPPAGFIFHMSRCGSTLVSQMLASIPRNVVISEAAPIDTVIRARDARPDVPLDRQILWLRGMIAAIAQIRPNDARHVFVKFDCWHTLALPLIRQAFPSVPWIFLYRDPVEVLVSNVERRGVQMVPQFVAPETFGIESSHAADMPAHEYCARVVAKICDAAVQHHAQGGALLVNYRQLPDALPSSIMRHFGVEWSDEDHDRMAEAASRDAKSPYFHFAPDSSAKQERASAPIRAAAETWLGDVFRQLETLRLAAA